MARAAGASVVGAWAALATLAGCAPSTDQHPFGARPHRDHALRGQLYHLKKGADRLPDFAKLSPKATVFAERLDAAPQNSINGFQGVTDHNEWFAFDYTAGLLVATPGRYGFRLVSDDGSRLLIDGRTVIDNDGVHPPKSASGEADLAAGPHTVEVQYFKGPHYLVALQLYCTKPGGAEAVFPGCGLELKTPSRLSDHVWWIWLGGLILVGLGWWWLRGRRSSAPR